MTLTTTLLTTFAAALLATGAARSDDAEKPKGDLGKLQGVWTAKPGPEMDSETKITFKGGEMKIAITDPDGEEQAMEGIIVLDEAAKPNKAITFMGFIRPNGSSVPENLGIYHFDGDDRLWLCAGGPGKDRPTEFKAGSGGPPQLVVLTRKK